MLRIKGNRWEHSWWGRIKFRSLMIDKRGRSLRQWRIMKIRGGLILWISRLIMIKRWREISETNMLMILKMRLRQGERWGSFRGKWIEIKDMRIWDRWGRMIGSRRKEINSTKTNLKTLIRAYSKDKMAIISIKAQTEKVYFKTQESKICLIDS